MRTKLRIGGLAAAVSATALVVPLLAMSPAEAVPDRADVSVTKTVRTWSDTTIAVPDDFNPTWGDTRATGGYELVGTGLRVWTGPNNPGFTNKAAEYVDTDTPLDTIAAGADPTLSYTPLGYDNANNQQPGFQLVIDLNGDAVVDGILVGEPSNLGKWWLGRYKGQAALDPAIVTAAPHPPAGGGPSQGPWGTLAEWDTNFPSAKVVAFGFSLGSNSGQNNGVISAINFNNTVYTFGTFTPSLEAAPGETVEYKLTVSNSASAQLSAAGVVVTDTLPADLTYVDGSLSSTVSGCAFAGQKLTCNAGTLAPGATGTIRFRATLDRDIDNDNLPTTIGHDVTVQKQETFADLPAHQSKTYTTMCPSGYTATDGSLLIDAVDQGGFYSDIVTTASKPTPGNDGWTVTATNYGDFRGQGKVHVTCLSEQLGSSSGHTHTIVVGQPSSGEGSVVFDDAAEGYAVNVACPGARRPIRPSFSVDHGFLSVRESYAHTPTTWRFVVDADEGTQASFGVDCLAPKTSEDNGHRATISLSDALATVSVSPEGRTEVVTQCPGTAHAIVGGYSGEDASVMSLGKEPRGTNYMFRFYNEDWDAAFDAYGLVTCVGVRTDDEPTYYRVINTATVSTTTFESNTADNSSSATVTVVGDPVPLPPFAVVVGPDGGRSFNLNGKTKSVDLQVKCEAACTFSAKVVRGTTVVATGTKSLAGSAAFKTVKVKTTSAGKNLGAVKVDVKVTTPDGLSETYEDVQLS